MRRLKRSDWVDLVNILYIAGYGRSGSSILARLLAQQAGIVSLGEFHMAPRKFGENAICSCGEPLSDCEFWAGLERPATRSSLLHGLEKRGDVRWAIDSSKTAYSQVLEPLKYLAGKRPFRLIQLVRHPEHVLSSARKGRNKDLERGVVRKRRFEAARTVTGWACANAVAAVYRLAMGRAAMRVSYEELLTDPSEVLARIERELGIDLSDAKAVIEHDRPLDAGHEIGGNRTLRSGPSGFRRLAARPVRENGLGWRFLALVSRPIGG